MGEKGLTRSLEGAGMHAELTCNTQRQPHVNTRLSHTHEKQNPSFLLQDRRKESDLGNNKNQMPPQTKG